MIICAGEILADMTITNAERGAEGRISAECSAGGAPFNVACCLKKLGVSCGFCGNVGDDAIGNYLYGIASLQNFDYLYIGKDTVHNTTLAFVRLNADGERKFGFYRKNTADAYLPVDEAENIAKKADIIHIGSLAVSSARGRLFLDKLIDGAHKQGKKISFDVNYRDDIFRDKDAAVKLYRKYIRKADIVKFSEEEIDMFVRGEKHEDKLIKAAGQDKTVFLTLGCRGSMACIGGKIYYAPAAKTEKIKDTNGAGDAFMAGALALSDGEKRSPDDILAVANACGALAVSQKGAYPVWDKSSLLAITKN